MRTGVNKRVSVFQPSHKRRQRNTRRFVGYVRDRHNPKRLDPCFFLLLQFYVFDVKARIDQGTRIAPFPNFSQNVFRVELLVVEFSPRSYPPVRFWKFQVLQIRDLDNRRVPLRISPKNPFDQKNSGPACKPAKLRRGCPHLRFVQLGKERGRCGLKRLQRFQLEPSSADFHRMPYAGIRLTFGLFRH